MSRRGFADSATEALLPGTELSLSLMRLKDVSEVRLSISLMFAWRLSTV